LPAGSEELYLKKLIPLLEEVKITVSPSFIVVSGVHEPEVSVQYFVVIVAAENKLSLSVIPTV
jgi:hypothetical protein